MFPFCPCLRPFSTQSSAHHTGCRFVPAKGLAGMSGLLSHDWLPGMRSTAPHRALNQVRALRLVRSPPLRDAGLFMFATGRIITVYHILIFVSNWVKIINCTVACWHDFDRSVTSFLFHASVGIALCWLVIIHSTFYLENMEFVEWCFGCILPIWACWHQFWPI